MPPGSGRGAVQSFAQKVYVPVAEYVHLPSGVQLIEPETVPPLRVRAVD